ncbi:MAG: hypothetical protein AAF518_02020 [Spirochaetota bacterium]
MERSNIIKEGTFGKIVLQEDTLPYQEVVDSGWYDTHAVYICLRAINELRKDYGNINIADIGSNPGYYTIPFARNTGGIVYSFGLNSEMRSLLSRSIFLNKLQNVLIFDRLPVLENHSSEKKSYSLDSLDMENLRFIKFDLKPGKIRKILNGCKKTILKYSPVLYFSFLQRDFLREVEEIDAIFQYLQEKEYFMVLFPDSFIAIPSLFFWAYYPHFKDRGLIIDGSYQFLTRKYKSNKYSISHLYAKMQQGLVYCKNKCYKLRWKYRLYKNHYI